MFTKYFESLFPWKKMICLNLHILNLCLQLKLKRPINRSAVVYSCTQADWLNSVHNYGWTREGLILWSSATASQCMVKGPSDHPAHRHPHLCPLCVCVFAVCCWVTVKIKLVEVICWRCTRSWLDRKFQCKQVVFFKVADLTNASGIVWTTLTI